MGPVALQRRPYGEWTSAILAGAEERVSTRVRDVGLRAGRLRWVERRPAEGGRCALMAAARGAAPRELLPAPGSARTRAFTYGGRCVDGDGARTWFSQDGPLEPGRLMELGAEGGLRALTPPGPWRFAEPTLDAGRDRMICTWEDFGSPGPLGLPRLHVAAVPLSGGAPRSLVSGRDLICAPRLSPDGARLAWLAWDYPQMPWDGAELWVAELSANGQVRGARRVAGGPDEACQQPRFLEDGALVFLSDRGGAWALHAFEGGHVRAIGGPEGEQGVPQWRLGPSTWASLSGGRAAVASARGGRWSLHLVDLDSGDSAPIETGCAWLGELCAEGGELAFVGASPRSGPTLYRGPAEGPFEGVRDFTPPGLAALSGQLSAPEPFTFPTPDGASARAVFYPPRNDGFEAPPGERPPLIVCSHGGPTSASDQALNLDLQFFTSRGFAVVDVDYRGSTGYGRAYRLALYGRWGELDVMDCAAAARHLVQAGRVDGARVLARGKSAGGYTTLALAAFTDLLRGGVSYYGVSDLLTLASPTNALERFYPDALVGPLPESEALYVARSPARQAHRVRCPTLFFQGEDDPGVPAQQTRDMVAALRQAGAEARAVYFGGEGHGFRRAETRARCLQLELAFYAEVLGLTLPGSSPTGGSP